MNGQTLIGALALGIFVFFAVGMFLGYTPNLKRHRRPKAHTKSSQVWLSQAGLDLTPRQFWSASATIAFIALTFFWLLTGSVAIAIVPAVSIGLLPRAYFARRRITRLSQVLEAWPDAIRELVGSIQANSSLHSALIDLSTSGPVALRQAFARFPTLSATLGVVPALEIIREEMADPTSDRVIEVLILAHERGGGIVTEILRDLARSTTQDIRVAMEIETDALEQKINSRAVFILPWLILVFLTPQAGPFRDFYQTTGGLLTVIAGGILSLGGMFWVSRLAKDPVEARVFGGSAVIHVEAQL